MLWIAEQRNYVWNITQNTNTKTNLEKFIHKFVQENQQADHFPEALGTGIFDSSRESMPIFSFRTVEFNKQTEVGVGRPCLSKNQ